MLSQQQIDEYRRDGYVVARNVLSADLLARAQAVTEELIDASRHVSSSDDKFDLDVGHCASSPRLTRIKTPHLQHPVYNEILTSPAVLDCIKSLLGPSVRLGNSKLNTKAGGGGAPVQWHQDWAFYPHTNDDLLAVGIMLNDIDESKGPLRVVPGSHLGEVFSHTNNGVFCGAVDPQQCTEQINSSVSLTGKAGDMSIHHVRSLHGSAPNVSEQSRWLLLYECAAADAWPINGMQSAMTGLRQSELWDYMHDNLLCGEQTVVPRLANVPVVMPLPPPPDATSIFRVQESGGAVSAF